MNYLKKYSTFYYRVIIGKINYFEGASVADMKIRPNSITWST